MTDPAQLADLAINQPDVALIFEGGGMRNSYTAPMVVELLARNLNFGCVYGISAGSSHTVNYLVRDATRARASFVELVKYPRFGGWGSFLRGTGYFNSPYLYEELIENAPAGDPMAFDWDTFAANPAEMHIEAMDWDTGETVAWTRTDVKDAHDLGLKVRASSTMPLFMPPTTIDGHTYMDGGMGDSWGILLNAARADGYERFCIIRTQPRGYRKHAMSRGAQALFRDFFVPTSRSQHSQYLSCAWRQVILRRNALAFVVEILFSGLLKIKRRAISYLRGFLNRYLGQLHKVSPRENYRRATHHD